MQACLPDLSSPNLVTCKPYIGSGSGKHGASALHRVQARRSCWSTATRGSRKGPRARQCCASCTSCRRALTPPRPATAPKWSQRTIGCTAAKAWRAFVAQAPPGLHLAAGRRVRARRPHYAAARRAGVWRLPGGPAGRRAGRAAALGAGAGRRGHGEELAGRRGRLCAAAGRDRALHARRRLLPGLGAGGVRRGGHRGRGPAPGLRGALHRCGPARRGPALRRLPDRLRAGHVGRRPPACVKLAARSAGHRCAAAKAAMSG